MDIELTCKKLNGNEYVSMGAIKIVSIPDVSLIMDEQSDDSIAIRSKKMMESLLTEINQLYKINKYRNEISTEILWKTEKVDNQPYEADICIFLVVRAIDDNEKDAIGLVRQILDTLKRTLGFYKFEYQEISSQDYTLLLNTVDYEKSSAVVKEDQVEDLHNAMLPYCYSVDCFPISNTDLSSLIKTLIKYPNSAVSFQLTCTHYTSDEKAAFGSMTQLLDTLANGVGDEALGSVSFSFAKKQADLYRYYSENKEKATFNFNILVHGSVQANSHLTSSIIGQLNSESDQSINLTTIDLKETDVNVLEYVYPLPWAINEVIQDFESDYDQWVFENLGDAYLRLPYVITLNEATEFFRLPFGSKNISAGLDVIVHEKENRSFADKLINSSELSVGKLKSQENNDIIGFSLNDLTKHMLVTGTPGSGKTTYLISLLDRLWKEHNIPFLVIEPAKNEYRALIQSIPDIQIFTPGKNFLSPLLLNPFVPPKNVRLETYKSTIKTAFEAAISMSSPLDKIFEETINNCYSDFRWFDSYTTDNKGKIFNIDDFIACFKYTFDQIGYTGDAKNIGRAGLVRLNALTNLFDNYSTIPIEDLVKKPTIIELSAIENSDEKSLIIALILLSVLSYTNYNYLGDGELKNLILLEEAHVLLDATSKNSEGEANPSSIAKELLKRMLAEIRAYGVSVVIADQSPRKVGADVVGLTDIKLGFRLVEAEDKTMLSDSIGLNENQKNRLSRLKPGEAFLYFNKLDEAEELITPNYRLDNNISISLSDQGLKNQLSYWDKHKKILRPYPECEASQYCSKDCDLNTRMIGKQVSRRILMKHFQQETNDKSQLKDVYSKLQTHIKRELNDEILDRRLVTCSALHLFRRVKYETKISLSDQEIIKAIKKL